jgi:hypothetical protein
MSNNIDPTLRAGVLTRLLRTDEAEEREAPPESLFLAKAAGDSFESGPIVKLASSEEEDPNEEDPNNARLTLDELIKVPPSLSGREAATILSQDEGFAFKLYEASDTAGLRLGQFDEAALQKLASGEAPFTDATPEQMQAAQYYLEHSGALEALDNGDGTVDNIYSFEYLTLFADTGAQQLEPGAGNDGNTGNNGNT